MATLTDKFRELEAYGAVVTIEFNNHWSVYQTVKQEYDAWPLGQKLWADPEVAIEKNTMVTVRVYCGDPEDSGKYQKTKDLYHCIGSDIYKALNLQEHQLEPCDLSESIKRLMAGNPNNLNILFNQEHAFTRYTKYGDYWNDPYEHSDWVSDNDHIIALETNRVWTVHYYIRTPIGFCRFHTVNLVDALNDLADERLREIAKTISPKS